MAAPEEYLSHTALKWKPNGELALRDSHALTALVMAADKQPFTIPQTKPMTYVALVADYTGRYAHVYGNANSWVNFIGQLEDIGCEVIENQTDEYDSFDPEDLKELDVVPIQRLVKDTDFVPHP